MLHGICYAFFFATVYIFVDEFFPKDVRASAQGLFNLMILGFGPLVANILGPRLMGETFNSAGVVDFRSLFLVPTAAPPSRPLRWRSSFTRRNRHSFELLAIWRAHRIDASDWPSTNAGSRRTPATS